MKYRKKPVLIQAVQWKPQDMLIKDVMNELGIGEFHNSGIRSMGKKQDCLIIKTLEGEMTAIPDDYIIKGIQGEIYPCKPDIFEATYEAVECENSHTSLAAESIRSKLRQGEAVKE